MWPVQRLRSVCDPCLGLDFPLVLTRCFVLGCWSTERAAAENVLPTSAAPIAWFFSGLAHFVGTYTPDTTVLGCSLCGTSTRSFNASVSHWAWRRGRTRFGWLQGGTCPATCRVPPGRASGTAINSWITAFTPRDSGRAARGTPLLPKHLPYGTSVAGPPSVSQHPGIDLAVSLDALGEASSQPTRAWEVRLSEDAQGLIAQLSVLRSEGWGYCLWAS